jgi:hypothetical protein
VFVVFIVLFVLYRVPSVCCVYCFEQHNDQKKMTEGQATQWPKEQGQKDKQQSDQRKGTEGQATQ